MGNKVLFELDVPEVKIRRFWHMNPVTKVFKSKKKYNRKKNKKEIKEEQFDEFLLMED